MALVFLGLGSNLGNGPQQLDQALQLLTEQAGTLQAVSSYLESEPWGFASEHRFTNAVCALETSLSPEALLQVTQAIERQMGRTHKHKPGESYTDRIIDVDLLIYEADAPAFPYRFDANPMGIQLQTERLTLPHPLIQARPFVLNPLKECIERLNALKLNN